MMEPGEIAHGRLLGLIGKFTDIIRAEIGERGRDQEAMAVISAALIDITARLISITALTPEVTENLLGTHDKMLRKLTAAYVKEQLANVGSVPVFSDSDDGLGRPN